ARRAVRLHDLLASELSRRLDWRRMLRALIASAALAGPLLAQSTQGPSPDDARTAVSKAARWLVSSQKPDGSWGEGSIDSVQFTGFSPETYYAFKMGADALAVMAMLSLEETPERRAALDRGLEWLCS